MLTPYLSNPDDDKQSLEVLFCAENAVKNVINIFEVMVNIK